MWLKACHLCAIVFLNSCPTRRSTVTSLRQKKFFDFSLLSTFPSNRLDAFLISIPSSIPRLRTATGTIITRNHYFFEPPTQGDTLILANPSVYQRADFDTPLAGQCALRIDYFISFSFHLFYLFFFSSRLPLLSILLGSVQEALKLALAILHIYFCCIISHPHPFYGRVLSLVLASA